MKQCLRCNKPCSAPSSLCEQCSSELLDSASEDEQASLDLSALATNPLPSVRPQHEAPNPITPIPSIFVSGPAEKVVQELVSTASDTPPEKPAEQKNIYSVYNNIVEQSLHRLNDAARRIAADPDSASVRSPHAPRVNRLTPIRDISADIHRDNTPSSLLSYDTQPGEQSLFAGQLPDFWPWLQEAEEEPENTSWRTDPLSARHLPTNEESARIEEEDLRRAIAQGISSVITAVRKRPQKLLRILFICTTVFALLALIIDTILVTSLNNRSPKNPISAPPSLVLSKTVVHSGDSVGIRLKNFSPASLVVVSRDIQERIHLAGGNSVVSIGPDGTKDVTLLIEANWDPGIHTIEAEDIQTRYTASATLRIDAGPTRPASLQIDAKMIDFGTSIQGANTIQPLNLKNGGSSSITWSASSDAAWLMLSPTHGVFSDHQSIQVAGSRTHMKPGDYTGKITFSSNADKPQGIEVHMNVRELPPNPGAVLSVTPPLLTFMAVDGMADPGNQSLMINNPGSQPLYWSIGNNQQTTDNTSYLAELNSSVNWLSPAQTSGTVVPGSTSSVAMQVHSRNLLPGTYTNQIMLSSGSGHSALNTPQVVSISLTVQPRCGLTLNTGSMFFTAVSGQDSPATQTLSLTAAASCPGVVPWSAIASDSWLQLTPTSGQLKGVTTSVMTVRVSTAGVKPGVYNGNITIAVGQNTQSVAVQLTVQAPPLPTAPIVGVAPLNLNFSTTQNQPDPPGQTVTISNTGKSMLRWHTTSVQLGSSWLGASPVGGSIPPDQTGTLTVHVSASDLSPGSYAGQVILEGVDQNNAAASGSPQTVSITFVVLPPCTLSQPSASSLAFNTTQGASAPSPLQETFTVSGNCSWPVNWKASATPASPGVTLTPSSGTFASSGQSATLSVTPNSAGVDPGTYKTSVSITATDSAGLTAQGSSQTFTVGMTVQTPCQLQIGASKLNFTAAQGYPSSGQSLSVSEGGNCAQPVTWNTDIGGSNWLVLSPPSGQGSSLSVNADATKLAPGSYTATITFSASGSGGVAVSNKPQVSVTLTVTGATVSGTVNACTGSTCNSTLPGASVSLTDSSGNVASNTTADSKGNFSLPNVLNGSYTLSAKGTDAASVTYQGNTSVKVSGDQTGVVVNANAPAPTPSPKAVSTPTSF